MKKSCKGFTLVELLIVIMILGALATTMTLSSGKATASAKAASIVNNLGTMRNAALLYYMDNMDSDDKTLSNSLSDDLVKYVNYNDFSTGSIKYSLTGNTRNAWTAICDFANDSDSKDIAGKLGAYKWITIETTDGTARMNLMGIK